MRVKGVLPGQALHVRCCGAVAAAAAAQPGELGGLVGCVQTLEGLLQHLMWRQCRG